MIVNGVPSVNRAYRVNIRTKLERTVDVGCVGRLIEHSGDFGQRKPQYCNSTNSNTCIYGYRSISVYSSCVVRHVDGIALGSRYRYVAYPRSGAGTT